MQKQKLIELLEKNDYEVMKKAVNDTLYSKVWNPEVYYDDPTQIPENTFAVLSVIYVDREAATYINFESEQPSEQEIANANKIHEDDFDGVIEFLQE